MKAKTNTLGICGWRCPHIWQGKNTVTLVSSFQGPAYPPSLSEDEKRQLNQINQSNLRREKQPPIPESGELNKSFLHDEVAELISAAKAGKAPGLEALVYDCLKNKILIKVLTELFNVCLSTAIIPSTWRKAIICPIPKFSATDPRVPLNFRGISLLLVVSKLYTATLCNRLSKFFEKHQTATNRMASGQNALV